MTANTETRTARPLEFRTGADPVAADTGLLLLRLFFGGLLFVHGTQKLFGWFNGYGLTATADGFGQMGYNPGKFFAVLAGLCEAVGGGLLFLGLLTPLAAAIVLGTMINAMNVTWSGGLAGYESALLFAVVAVALGFTGPGRFSLDHGRAWQRKGIVWGTGAFVLGVVAAVVTLLTK
ncbi:DoxX family protein [Nocardia veterana]|uniref:DoxX family protein n=1 Tax=Nocardia veterana TaxID=132249 RepID=A0A7X6M2I5_9NOCA|nr:DoxX family protein [Nocardia veterana]NKY89100.1 DoxX family protein [Nocardia veterana]